MQLAHYKSVLEQAGVRFAPGLTATEAQQIEATYQLRFPPDLRAFLMFALPISNRFVNWRDASPADIRSSLAWPADGICFDIEHNAFWLDAWGPKPESHQAACEIARQAVAHAPTLIPIAGHRYIPDRPSEASNPIFSVYQTDIIYYGSDLFDYLENEFSYHFGRPGYRLGKAIKHVEFWSDLVG